MLRPNFAAKSADLPLIVVPCKNLSAAHLSACRGVNFAYSGATGSSCEKEYRPRVDESFSRYCTKALSSSLFMMNFGTNDYGSAFRQNHSMEEIKKNNLVSDVVEARKQALKKIISRGARKVLVFGVALDGCRPISLAMQSANKSATYDRFGCVKRQQ
ncbi:hypothetical protein OIU78_010776 [Salix suchowensis]|nr:hypothetical protein OIU78_010776 [Salix suchowensis]